MKLKYEHNYDDIINLEHYKSKKHPPMSLYERSAQFAPFSALTGYGEAVCETAREVASRIDIDDEVKSILDIKIQMLYENPDEEITVTYFVPDSTKEGGAYISVAGITKRVDKYNQVIILENGLKVPINEIIDISGEIFKRYK